VSDIITTGSRVSGVLLMDGELIQADVVVCTIQPGRLGTLMGRQQETVTSRLLGHSQTDRHNYGRSILSLLLVTAAPVITKDEDQMPLRTIIVPSQAGGETSEQRSHRASHHAFAQSTITVHRSHRPAHADTHSWVLHADCPPHSVAGAGIDWTEPGQATMQANCLLDVVRSVGLDLGEHVAIRQIRTPYDLEHELGAPGGIVHGSSSRLAHNPLGKTITTVVPRPANQTRVKGLFLAGAGAHPGPTVPLAGASAAIVADLVGRA
jgi:phytoene dehydrogenase-like protein